MNSESFASSYVETVRLLDPTCHNFRTLSVRNPRNSATKYPLFLRNTLTLAPRNNAARYKLVPADDTRERDYMGHLANYYDEVIACIGDAETILIFGPGEAKGELKKRMEREKIGIRIVAMETADKMTEAQIVAKLKQRLF